jgi:hypothetical protein
MKFTSPAQAWHIIHCYDMLAINFNLNTKNKSCLAYKVHVGNEYKLGTLVEAGAVWMSQSAKSSFWWRKALSHTHSALACSEGKVTLSLFDRKFWEGEEQDMKIEPPSEDHQLFFPVSPF